VTASKSYANLRGTIGREPQEPSPWLARSEEKEYIVKDGEVIHFLFNV